MGPSEWDDNLYCDMAAIPRGYFEVANRYVHIWTLRLFYLLLDTRQEAAAWYANLVVIGLSWMGFLLGRRIGGTACGLVAAATMPLYPAVLRYVTVPYPDPPMTLWSGLALACALGATASASARRNAAAAIGAGLFCFLAVKCKETGLAVLPAVALALWVGGGRARRAAYWFAGALAGWLLLSLADWAFLGDFWWSWRWSNYFAKPGSPGISGPVRDDFHYFDLLASTEFLPFTLMGVAGAAMGFRRSGAVRAVTLWAFGALMFSSLISIRYAGIHALDRYCVAIGAPLVVLSAYWILTLWRRTTEEAPQRSAAWLAASALTLLIAAYGLGLEVFDHEGPRTGRFAFFMMPVAQIVLFLAPWLAPARRWVRLSLVLLLASAAGVSTEDAREYVEFRREVIAPWEELTDAMDDAGAQLVRFRLPPKPYAAIRIARRCRSLSDRPPGEIASVREVNSLDEVRQNEWVFSSPEAAPLLQRSGWRPWLRGTEPGGVFVVYRRDGGA